MYCVYYVYACVCARRTIVCDHMADDRCVYMHGLLKEIDICYVMLRYVTLWYVMLRCVTLCYVMLRYVTLCYVMLRYVTLCYVMLRYVTLCYVMLRYVTLCFLGVSECLLLKKHRAVNLIFLLTKL